MKKMSLRALAFILMFCIAIPFVSCGNTETTDVEGYSYVTIDVNPSVELAVDGETVVSVNAVNDDALVLLAGESIEGMKLEEATEKIVSLCEELGYLTDENNNVKLTVTADTDDLIEKVEEIVEKGAKKGSLKAVINKIPRNIDQRKVAELKEKNAEVFDKLTAQKLRLIESIMELSEEMTYEIGAEMKVSELVDMLKELTKGKIQGVNKEVREQMDARLKELKNEAKRRVAEIYGEEYLEKWNIQNQINDLYDELKDKAENIEISVEDINTIIELLSLESIEEISSDGKITVEDIEKYIDKHLFSEEFDEVVEQINAIITKYVHNEYVPNEEELARIKEIMGDIEIDKLDDLKNAIDEHEKMVDSIKDNIELSEIENGFVNIIENGYAQMKEQVNEEFEQIINEAKDELHRIKNEKRETNKKH